MTIDKPLLEINNLHVGFRIKDDFYDAVDNVSLTLEKNEILAIVGESGCGKSTLATTIMGLHNKNNTKITGDILYNDVNLVNLNEALYNKIRGNDMYDLPRSIGFIKSFNDNWCSNRRSSLLSYRIR